MLYKPCLVRSDLFTTQKSDFFNLIWLLWCSMRLLWWDLLYLLLKNQIFTSDLAIWGCLCYYLVTKLLVSLYYWLFTATTGYLSGDSITGCDASCLKSILSCFSMLALCWYCSCSLRYCLYTFWCSYCLDITGRIWQVTPARVLGDRSFINSFTLFRYECLYCLSLQTLDIRCRSLISHDRY